MGLERLNGGVADLATLAMGWWEVLGGELRPFLLTYLLGVTLALLACTTIRPGDGVALKAIFVAAFSWPISLPVVVWKALSAR